MKLRNIVRRMQKSGKDAARVLKKRHYLDALYDSFRIKNMTRRGFKKAYGRLMDPKRMAREAEDIALHNRVRQSLRRR
jgi:hypothetical protein